MFGPMHANKLRDQYVRAKKIGTVKTVTKAQLRKIMEADGMKDPDLYINVMMGLSGEIVIGDVRYKLKTTTRNDIKKPKNRP